MAVSPFVLSQGGSLFLKQLRCPCGCSHLLPRCSRPQLLNYRSALHKPGPSANVRSIQVVVWEPLLPIFPVKVLEVRFVRERGTEIPVKGHTAVPSYRLLRSGLAPASAGQGLRMLPQPPTHDYFKGLRRWHVFPPSGVPVRQSPHALGPHRVAVERAISALPPTSPGPMASPRSAALCHSPVAQAPAPGSQHRQKWPCSILSERCSFVGRLLAADRAFIRSRALQISRNLACHRC
ncbi:hypothetical protein NDU88_004640 [Pleurodeles waltl]|uniref:Uncharacterized protein n=1 Tax=Pleurodeles waltl TaxID=8319 RepID=A0AAV7M6X1_PLEWA|nr:hypothetical protein NDU88_004640 [Pleurodeles waltl]